MDDQNYTNEFGARIKKRRKALGLTQEQFAEQLGISPNHVSSIENGKSDASIKVTKKICNTLKINPDYLFLGNMHSNNISEELIDVIKACSKQDQEILYKIAQIYAERNYEKNR